MGSDGDDDDGDVILYGLFYEDDSVFGFEHRLFRKPHTCTSRRNFHQDKTTTMTVTTRKRKSTTGSTPSSTKETTTTNPSSKKPKKEDPATDSATPNATNYWLIKAEPESRIEKGKDVKFSIDDLAALPNGGPWDGVRNYEARNILRDKMKINDLCLFYHSNCKLPGVAGIARVVKNGYPDYTAFDPTHPYYDVKSVGKEEAPVWYMVDVEFVRKLKRFVSLDEIKYWGEKGVELGGKKVDLKEMVLLKRGRLSVQPVRKEEFDLIVDLENRPSPLTEASKGKKK